MIHTAICDDNRVMLDYLDVYISEYFTNHLMPNETQKFLSAKDFFAAYDKSHFDVVFLDIKMPDIDGFEAAKRIRQASEKTHIVFITTESNLVYDSFYFQPFGFVPKIPKESMELHLERALSMLCAKISNDHPLIFHTSGGGDVKIIPSELIYLKSNGNYTEYFVKSKDPARIRIKLDNAMKDLSDNIFVRPHKSYGVNMGHVKKIIFPKMQIILENEIMIPISKPNKKQVEEKYSRYLRNWG